MRSALAVGSSQFVERLRRQVRGNRRTQPDIRRWQRLLPFARVTATVAARKGEAWEWFRDRHGDDGRDMALWLGRQHCGLTLAELGSAAGGLSAAATGAAIRRVEDRCNRDHEFRSILRAAEQRLLESETRPQ